MTIGILSRMHCLKNASSLFDTFCSHSIHRVTRDVISMPSGFRRHLVGKTLINVFHCNIAEIRSVGKLVIIQTFHKPTDRMIFK